MAAIALAGALAGMAAAGCQREDRPDFDGAAADRADAAALDLRDSDTGAVDCMPTKHPGTVTLVNEVTGEVKVETLTPETEPRWWRDTFAGRVAIVKSVYTKPDGGPAEIFLYGVCGQLVEVILGAP